MRPRHRQYQANSNAQTFRTLNDWYEFLAYLTVNFCTVLWIKMIMTNDGEHDASPLINFPISTLFWEDDSVRRLSCQPRISHVSSTNAVSFSSPHNETRSIAVGVNNSDRSPVGIHGMSLIQSIIETRSPPGLTRSYPRRFTLITRTASCSRQLP
jgi:hypothetical protein